jgi:hypothetical protein
MVNTYVTFGQVHVHSINGKTFDKDCVALIKADNSGRGRDRAMEIFKGSFFTTYSPNPPDMEWFPRGIIEV